MEDVTQRGDGRAGIGPSPTVKREKRTPWVFPVSSVDAAAVLGVVVGAALWIIGARYTIDGVTWCANWIIAFVGVSYTIEMFPLLYLYLIPIPIVMSLFEWKGHTHLHKIPAMVFLYGFVHLGDLISTGAGLWQADVSFAVILLVSPFLTYTPEWVLRNCVKIIRGRLAI